MLFFRRIAIILMPVLSFTSIGKAIAQEGLVKEKLTNAISGTDTILIDQLFKRAAPLSETHPDSAIIILKQSLQLSIQGMHSLRAAKALCNLGLCYADKTDYAQGIFYYKRAAELCNTHDAKTQTLLAVIYLNLSGAYSYQSKYDTAATYAYRSLDLFKKNSGPDDRIAFAYIKLGIIWLKLAQSDLALRYFDLAERIGYKKPDSAILVSALLNKGVCYMGNNKLDEAKICFQKALAISTKIKDLSRQQSANLNLGIVYLNQKQPKEAITYFSQATKSITSKSDAIITNYALGEAYFLLKQYKKAEECIVPAMEYAMSAGMLQQLDQALKSLIKIYEATGQYKKAFQYEKTYNELRDSLLRNEKTQTISLLEIKSRTAEKDKEITEKRLMLIQKNNQLKDKNILIGGISAGGLILIICSISIYRVNAHKQRLQSEQIRNMKQEREISELKAMIEGEEKERSRVARELHDGLGSLISTAIMNYIVLGNEHPHITMSPTYSEVMKLMDEMGIEMRKTVNNLMPEVLLRYSLPDAIKMTCDQVRKNKLISIDLQTYGQYDLLDHAFTLSVYRIIQELMHNIVKHSEASHVLVQLFLYETSLSITVEDNGKGFDPAVSNSGMGLRNLKVRVNSLQGHLSIESQKNRGTTVYIEFDLREIKKIAVV